MSMVNFMSKIKNYFSANKRTRRIKDVPVPVQLGIYIERGEELVEELNRALSPHFQERMKYRFLQEHPNWQQHEFEWAFLN